MIFTKAYDRAYRDIDTVWWQGAKIRQLEARLNRCAVLLQVLGLTEEDALVAVKANDLVVTRTENEGDPVVWYLHGISYSTAKRLLPEWDWAQGCGTPYRGQPYTTDRSIAEALTRTMQRVDDGHWQYGGKLEDLLG